MIQRIRGTQDILPSRYTQKTDAQIERWHAVERAAREAFRRYGFAEIRTPVLERAELFERGVGAETDVNKEMFVFQDRDGEALALRPESTAAVVRAYGEHGMASYAGLSKLYYIGPQFRHERPQKGRYRQFWQIGAEVLGQSDSPTIEAEVIEMLAWFMNELGIDDYRLLINSIGDANCRPAYVAKLKEAIGRNLDKLCGSCQRRYETNPLRVLDCKVDSCQPYLAGLPTITEALCPDCSAHFEEFKQLLVRAGITFEIAPRLVRGLDYYMRTAFEVVGKRLGSQDTLIGGGRYDGLSELIGGPPVKGFGFALGMERVILTMPEGAASTASKGPLVYVAYIGSEAAAHSFALARRLRQAGISVEVDLEGRKLKKSLAIANSLGARYALIVGDDEIAKGAFVLRDMVTGDQRELPEPEIADAIASGGR